MDFRSLHKVHVHRLIQLIGADDELTPLANQNVLALKLGQMFGDSRSRSANQAGDVLVAEGHAK